MDATPAITTCETCGAPIFKLYHVRTNKRAPIDARPSPDGDIVLEGVRCYRITKAPRQPGEIRYKNHYATCPSAKLWRGFGNKAVADP
jgi:hypothetical protein